MVMHPSPQSRRFFFYFGVVFMVFGWIIFMVSMFTVYNKYEDQVRDYKEYIQDTCTTSDFSIYYFSGLGTVHPTPNISSCVSWKNVTLFKCVELNNIISCIESHSTQFLKPWICYYKPHECTQVLSELEDPHQSVWHGLFIVLLVWVGVIWALGIILMYLSRVNWCCYKKREPMIHSETGLVLSDST